ncbi:MAG: hypothetical protein RIC04_07755 [Parvibaculum sp.]|uniref:hypothetical protein n=1 Tax=Parvibaculum sp. TaxID=2024848 RepID=UPI0032ED557D
MAASHRKTIAMTQNQKFFPLVERVAAKAIAALFVVYTFALIVQTSGVATIV